MTQTLGCLTPITAKPAGSQQNKQSSYENFGVSDDYESLDMQNIGTSTYESLQLNIKDSEYYNETFALNIQENDKDNNKCPKNLELEGIMIN